MTNYDKDSHIKELRIFSRRLAKEIEECIRGIREPSCLGKTRQDKIQNTIELKDFIDNYAKELSINQ